MAGFKIIAVMMGLLLTVGACNVKPAQQNKLKLYALDCGGFDVADIGLFSRAGKFDGQSYTLANPCFLIRHPKGNFLWDTGFDQALVDMPDGMKQGDFHMTMKTRLTDQLAQLGLTPFDIEHLSISHWHPDHSGNANLFAGSEFIINKTEQELMFSDEMKAVPDIFKFYSALETANTISFEAQHDVFGDGRVVITSMPGHTPGHSVLLVKLENSGAVLLTGDLYILTKGRELRTIHSANSDPDATLVSMDKFESLVKKENARVVIQHEKDDFEALPKFPAFLD